MKIAELENKRILILGLGREGLATLKFLQQNLRQANLAVADNRCLSEFSSEEQVLLNQIEQKQLGENYLQNLESYEVIVKSPGIYPRKREIQEALAAGVQITSATNIFFANQKGKIIGVTGSKGKSTVSSLIYRILLEANLPAFLIGNIGQPALSFLEKDRQENFYVFELSSYQLEDLKYAADIAVVTSFFPEHLDYHGNLESYFEAKMNIAKNLKKEHTLIYNAASKEVSALAKELACHILAFNDGQRSKVTEDTLYCNGEALLSVKEVPLLGKHNLENVLAACAVAKLLGIENETIQSATRKFKSLAHRLEFVGTYKEVDFYDDAISTTPESTIAALEAMPKQIGTLILGGLDRGYDFSKLAERVLEKEVPNVILFPGSGPRIREALQKINAKLPRIEEVEDLSTCIKKCFELTPAGTICLLSTASPSYNMFKNFEDKGDQFQKLVKG